MDFVEDKLYLFREIQRHGGVSAWMDSSGTYAVTCPSLQGKSLSRTSPISNQQSRLHQTSARALHRDLASRRFGSGGFLSFSACEGSAPTDPCKGWALSFMPADRADDRCKGGPGTWVEPARLQACDAKHLDDDAHVHGHVRKHTRTGMHVCMHACIHTCIHTRIRTYTYTCTHTYGRATWAFSHRSYMFRAIWEGTETVCNRVSNRV